MTESRAASDELLKVSLECMVARRQLIETHSMSSCKAVVGQIGLRRC